MQKIYKKDFEGFYPKTRLCGHHGKGVNKAVDVLVDPIEKRVWYEFSSFHRVVYCGPDLDDALRLFNEA